MLDMLPHRICRSCKIAYLATTEHFNRAAKGKYGFASWCKQCTSADSKRRHFAARDKRLTQQKAWRVANPTSAKDWLANHPGKGKTYSRKWREANRTEAMRLTLAWRATNLERVREHRRRSERKRRQDPKIRLSNTISTSIKKHIEQGSKRRRRWEILVGYSVDDLKRHLERGFRRGMTWRNMGKWHIDHVVPVCTFNFTTPGDPDFKACWALTNLQPLWQPENAAKSGKKITLL